MLSEEGKLWQPPAQILLAPDSEFMLGLVSIPKQASQEPVLQADSGKCGASDNQTNSFSPQGEAGSWGLFLLTLCWAVEKGYDISQSKLPTLFSPREQDSAPGLARKVPVLWVTPEKLEHCTHWSTLPPKVELRAKIFHVCSCADPGGVMGSISPVTISLFSQLSEL